MGENWFDCYARDGRDALAAWKADDGTIVVKVETTLRGHSQEASINIPPDQARALAYAILRMCGDEQPKESA